MQAAASEIWMYADPESHDLRHAIADFHGTTPEHVMVGGGIDTLLGDLVRLTVAEGDAVVTSAGAYPTFNYHVAGFGGALHTVPYAGDFEDPDRLIAKAQEVAAKLIYFANPDNPMGSWHGAETVKRMVANVPLGSLLVLDEAYVELAPEGTAPDIDPADPRVIRMRTFSKAHGMAGARVGYAIGRPEIIDAFNKVRHHFGINRIAQIGALAAIKDTDWLDQVRDKVAAARDQISQIALANGLVPLPSATNFVAIDCGADGDFARKVLGGLIAQGVFVRMPFVAPQDRCIRISAGQPEDLALFAEALPKALDIARS